MFASEMMLINIFYEEESLMKIAVVAANGRAGELITNEAIKRNHEVTAIVRHKNQTEASYVL